MDVQQFFQTAEKRAGEGSLLHMLFHKGRDLLWEPILQCFFPPHCIACNAPLFGYRSYAFCQACAQKIAFLGSGTCHFCGAGTGAYATLGKRCSECRGNFAFTRAAAVATFALPVRDLIHELKFRGNRRLARPMGEMMARRALEVDFPRRFDAVIPVPLHPNRLRERGFNQAELLARPIASSFQAPLDAKALERIRHTEAQALLDRRLRLQNPVGAFRATDRWEGATLLLVDDVMTTGSTVSECAAVLRQAGASRVYVLVFAR